MSIVEQVCALETQLQTTLQKCLRLQQENRSLHQSKQSLQAQCEELAKKNQMAKAKVELLLTQLTQMETNDV